MKAFHGIVAVICCLLFTIGLSAAGAPTEKDGLNNASIDTLVICPHVFQAEMVPWIAHREAQGHGIVMIQPELTSEAQKSRIREYAKQYPLKNLLLVGDN